MRESTRQQLDLIDAFASGISFIFNDSLAGHGVISWLAVCPAPGRITLVVFPSKGVLKQFPSRWLVCAGYLAYVISVQSPPICSVYRVMHSQIIGTDGRQSNYECLRPTDVVNIFNCNLPNIRNYIVHDGGITGCGRDLGKWYLICNTTSGSTGLLFCIHSEVRDYIVRMIIGYYWWIDIRRPFEWNLRHCFWLLLFALRMSIKKLGKGNDMILWNRSNLPNLPKKILCSKKGRLPFIKEVWRNPFRPFLHPFKDNNSASTLALRLQPFLQFFYKLIRVFPLYLSHRFCTTSFLIHHRVMIFTA